ncbi:hypothetical protein QFC22_002318 [Naganishia vaughanmartiniae]|uniref:Uncharacterized protein n=1 Tax=Naganishia vaughanmartiniae TaxID=1424756 RepID=A0ACC2XDN2_9TREE|nr:hypothetical protein QFC22_002318 [Naganishia vaughanmartiniae]
MSASTENNNTPTAAADAAPAVETSPPNGDTTTNNGPATTTDAASHTVDSSSTHKTHPVDLTAGGEDGHGTITLRALISTKEAGIIIGKAGETVAKLRDQTKVKAGVSKVVSGVQDRVLSITGTVDQIAEAYGEVARLLLNTPLSDPTHLPSNGFCSLRLLISHNLMGTIIGRQGSKIKQIQDASGCRMVASKEMLPQSTERVVEIQGNVEAMKHAVREVAECVLEDWERAQGTVPYHPGAAGDQGVLAGGLGAQTVTGPTGGIRRTSLATGPFGLGERRQSRAAPMPGGDRRKSEGAALLANGIANLNINPFASPPPPPVPMSGGAAPFAPGYHPVLSATSATFPLDPLSPATSSTFTPHTGSSLAHGSSPLANNNNNNNNAPSNGSSPTTATSTANLKTQNISIPSDMVGCIIGRAGSKITEIRRLSGSRISIAKNPHDESGERMFTIVGSVEANEKALYLLYSQLEIEKQRRVSAGQGAPASPGQGGYEHGA